MLKHWGVEFDETKPTTGVFQNNGIPYLSDDMYGDKAINVTCLLCEQDRKNEKDPNTETEEQDEECICDHCYIDFHEINIGFVKCDKEESVFKNINAKYHPDAEYQALVGEVYTQVINSKYVIQGRMCSPCYPGQVDANSSGQFWGYSLPPDMFDENDPIKKRIITIEEMKKIIENEPVDPRLTNIVF